MSGERERESTVKSFKACGPMFVGKQIFAGSWGRYLVGKKNM